MTERDSEAVQRPAIQRCATTVYGGGSFRGYQCSKPGKVERGGRWYCGLHDPERVAAKQAERNAKWAAERAEANASREAARLHQQELERDASLWRAHIAETQRSTQSEETK